MILFSFLHVFHQGEQTDVGCAWSFLLTLIAFAAKHNIIIFSCRPRSTQLVNNKPSWTETCETTANPGIIPLLLLLFAHYFSSPLAEDSQLNYFHPIVFFCREGQISVEDRQHLEMPLFLLSLFSLFTPSAPARPCKRSPWVLVEASSSERNYD